MAQRSPLVLGADGLPQQLQAGDSLPPGSGPVAGTALLDFGAAGSTNASVVVTGQTGITASSHVLVSVAALATADHSTDEHVIEVLNVSAGALVAGTGFTIFGATENLPLYGKWSINWLWI